MEFRFVGERGEQAHMTQDAKEPILTALFVDYDNIYLSLKKRSEEAAKRFAKDAVSWIKEVESGRLITATNLAASGRPRRIVVNRCYGNPVPRRNPHDNSTDMTSFPFVRHHFLRAGFEVIDCPPLTAQLKNSSDIKMVIDANDFLEHNTKFDEFIILSGDADFTPLMHRLRAHNRRTAIFANDYTAAAYTSLCDGEIRETTLMSILLEGKLASDGQKIAAAASAPAVAVSTAPAGKAAPAAPTASMLVAQPAPQVIERIRAEIIAAVVVAVRAAGSPVPLEALAERTTRALGHDRTIGTNWAGSSSFLELLRRHLPAEIRLTEQPPYLAYEAARAIAAPAERPMPMLEPRAPLENAPVVRAPIETGRYMAPPEIREAGPASAPVMGIPQQQQQRPAAMQATQKPAQQPPPEQRQSDMTAAIQASIARIHDACQAPPLSPPDYRALFDAIAGELGENGLQGSQTLASIHARAQQAGLNVSRDDIRFVMEVISEADPWFEQGTSAKLFAGRFRNFVVARCRSQGLNLSSDELDLIDAWFAGGAQQIAPQSVRVQAPSAAMGAQMPARQASQSTPAMQTAAAAPEYALDETEEQFPKILRTRLRG